MPVLIFLFLMAFMLVIYVVLQQDEPQSRDFPYEKRECVTTANETRFYQALINAVDEETVVTCQVRVADVLKVRGGLDKSDRMRAFSKISSKHFDFVLCDRSNMRIKAAIELDDRSHEQPRRQKRDDFLNGACEAAGLRLVRFKAQRQYESRAIEQALDKALSAPATTGRA